MDSKLHRDTQTRKTTQGNSAGVPILLPALLLILSLTVAATTAVASDGDWEAVDIGTTESLQGIWGADDDNIWVISRNDVIHYWNGTDWGTQPAPSAVAGFNLIDGIDAENVWVLNGVGALAKWNGVSWNAVAGSEIVQLWDGDFFSPIAMWVEAEDRIWAVGNDGARALWNGSAWVSPSRAFSQGNLGWLLGVAGVDQDTIWVASDSREIFRWDGTRWTSRIRGSNFMNDVVAPDLYTAWGAGSGGEIVSCLDGSWKADESGTSDRLNQIWAVNASNAWVIGESGTILRWDGVSWQSQNSGTAEYLIDIWGSDSNTLWVVGAFGTLLKSVQPLAVSPTVLLDGFEEEALKTPC